MSIRSNGSGDKLSIANTLTLGLTTGDFSMGVWIRRVNDTGTYADLICIATSNNNPGAGPVFGALLFSDGDSLYGGDNYTPNLVDSGFNVSSSTWYYVVISRASGVITVRIFDDSTSTTPLATQTVAEATSGTGVDSFVLGELWTGEWFDGEFQAAKLHIGDAWTDSEARAEASVYTFVLSTGTVRYAWRLKDTDADTDGLNEVGGAGPNLTNTGCVNGASTPTNLGEAGSGTTYQLSPTTSAVATTAVSMAARYALTATVGATSTVSTSTSAIAQLQPTVGATSTTQATLYKVTAVDMSTVDGVSTVSAGIQKQIPLTATVGATSSTSASLSGAQVYSLTATVAGAASAASSASSVLAGAATVAGQSAASATVATVAGVTAQADGLSNVTVSMSARYALTAEVGATSAASLEPSLVWALAATVDGVSAVSLALTVPSTEEVIQGAYAAEHARMYAELLRAGGQ